MSEAKFQPKATGLVSKATIQRLAACGVWIAEIGLLKTQTSLRLA
jgi:hypothetical protein